MYREGLRLLFERAGLHVVGTAADAPEAVRLARDLGPDLLVLDVSAAGYDGVRTLRALGELSTPPRILLVADENDMGSATGVVGRGADGVFSKNGDDVQLLEAIACVCRGEHWPGGGLAASRAGFVGSEAASRDAARAPARFGLTHRKLEIIAAIVGGRTNREIAALLGISEQTIKHHLSGIFERTGVSNRLELALFSLAHDLVDRGDLRPASDGRPLQSSVEVRPMTATDAPVERRARAID